MSGLVQPLHRMLYWVETFETWIYIVLTMVYSLLVLKESISQMLKWLEFVLDAAELLP